MTVMQQNRKTDRFMKKLFLIFALSAAAVFSANAVEKTKIYDFSDIRSIKAGHAYEIHVSEGNSDKVKVVYDDQFEKYMEISHSGAKGTLILEMKELPLKLRTGRNSGVKVYIEMDKIVNISLSGAASAEFEGKFKADELNIDLSGAAKMRELNINGRSLDLDCSGATNAFIVGNFDEDADIDMSGACKVIFNGNALSLEGDLSGACNLKADGNYDECSIECSGASEARLEGEADLFSAECSGASKIEAEHLIARKVDVLLIGSSKAIVNATKSLTYDVSRASKLIYYGDAELNDISHDSNVQRGM
jgi:hypothetical protein